ncbi:uncharacterized protein LOC134839875 [Symsagittifera roscoffensis]|uniref:uncharacterized protein LOC134839875 n=1 Tax=Symsagittifera roscoffensis TaxID=84072 RepID=UPI00307C3025
MPKGKKAAAKGGKSAKGKGKDDKEKPKKEYKHDNLTPEQIASIKETFDKFDKQDIDGIPALELINVLRQLQLTPTSPEVTEVLEKMHANSAECVVTFEEFLDIYWDFSQRVISEEQVKDAFKILDKEGKGEITVETLRQFLTTTGDMLDEDEFEAMIEEADLEGTGVINYEEFVTIMSIE